MMKNIISAYMNKLRQKGVAFLSYLSTKKYWLFTIITAYCLADIAIISQRSRFLSEETPLLPIISKPLPKAANTAEYIPIWDFNIFHDGPIPPPFSSKLKVDSSHPVRSLLPLQLNGTIVYQNSSYSVANITMKGKKSKVYQTHDTIFRNPKEETDPLAQITQIDLNRVYFINLNNNKAEYIEIRNTNKTGNVGFDFGKKTNNAQKKRKKSFIKQLGKNQFQMNRSDINKHLRSLPSILQSARVVPHWERGEMTGWRFTNIKSDSLFKTLGFQKSDVIISVAGERPRSQLHAAELFQRFKNLSKLDIVIKRKGKKIPLTWSVEEDVAGEDPPKSHYY